MDEVTETIGQRRSRQAREAARRAREYRARKKLAKTPDTRTVAQALTEALAFVLADTQAFMVSGPATATLPLLALLKAGQRILMREGYAAKVAADAIFEQLRERAEHRDADHVPSLRRRPPTIQGPHRLARSMTTGEILDDLLS